MLVILVFCERTAEVNWEMDPSSSVVKTRIGRPVIQDVLFYDQSTGELEIEASHQKHREVLRNSFAEGVIGDDSFFPMEEQTRVLNLQKLLDLDFKLPVRTGQSGANHCRDAQGVYRNKAVHGDPYSKSQGCD